MVCAWLSAMPKALGGEALPTILDIYGSFASFCL